MSESTSSMSDSTSHDNGESTEYKPSSNISLCLWWIFCISIFIMSLTGAVAGRQAGSRISSVYLHHIQNASLTLSG